MRCGAVMDKAVCKRNKALGKQKPIHCQFCRDDEQCTERFIKGKVDVK